MKCTLAVAAAFALAASFPLAAAASTVDFRFAGPGVSGDVALTYGASVDSKYPQAFEVTGVSGIFSDSNNGLAIADAPIGALVAITHDAPEPTNLLAPHDFSRFLVTSGLAHGSLSFDNLYYPGGSPQTATDYPVQGGVLDIYGVLINIGGGQFVNLWSNGDVSGTGAVDYGVAVVTSAKSLDYVSGGVSAVPEPSAAVLALAGWGVLALIARRRSQR